MNTALQPALFTQSQTDSPTVFSATTYPQRASKPLITFRFDKGEFALSKALFEQLNALDSRRCLLINHKNSTYVTKCKTGGFWMNLRIRDTSGVCSIDIAAKEFVQRSMRSLGHGPGDVISFPVVPYPVQASELGLDPAEFPYPLYRIVADQKSIKQK